VPRDRMMPVETILDTEQIMMSAEALFGAEQSADLRAIVDENIEDLRRYDVLAIDRVVAILSWGRSGSLLLASYLDGHEDVMMLPEICSARLYDFFGRYPSLSLRDKLMAYPAFEPHYYGRFFEGDFAISPARYRAAVQAILEFYAEWPTEFLESRRTFFLFVHIAYNLALGRRPSSSRPIIVYAQHLPDDRAASQLVEDFPEAKFVHTVRDPIASCSAMFQFLFGTLAENFPRTYTKGPYEALYYLTDKDEPHFGMESRTRTIRFEDLHSQLAETLRDLSEWLGLPFRETLLDSTFNGIPFVAKRDGKVWSGPRLEQARRDSRNLSPKDRSLLFALFYENFVDWNYPCPKIFGNRIVRCLVFASLVLFPTKMEIIAARGVFTRWILPGLRQGNIQRAIRSVLGIGFYRLKIIQLLAPAFFRRLVHEKRVLQVGDERRPPDWRANAQITVSNKT
jgi:hypothetical protein